MSSNGEELERGRESYANGSWRSAYEHLAAADGRAALGPDDLERLSTAAYMLGLEDEYFAILGRAHQGYLDSDDTESAARAALWVGLNLAQRGEMGQASGWLARAERLVQREERESSQAGYLLLPRMFREEAEGDLDAAIATAGEAVRIAERFGDADLLGLALHSQGHLLVVAGRATEGLRLLDESMVAVKSGDLSPIASGIVYCGVILGCQTAFEPRRAREWTAALTDWCRRQPDMVAFTGRCLVHRAEIMQLDGQWDEAESEAIRAYRRCEEGQNARAAGEALYRQGEIRRLQGDFGVAEEAYRRANVLGREPQPGLALLRLAQGETDAAVAAIRRALAEAVDEPSRGALLPASVEILLAAGHVGEAENACRDLSGLAAAYEGGLLGPAAAHATGAVELAQGEPDAALGDLREAALAWRGLGAVYEEARTRALLALACRELGDRDAAEMELDAALEALTRLGAAPDAARVRVQSDGVDAGEAHGLTDRELEVLRMVAGGKTNKAIATELVISGRTVDRHVSNIFAKLGVSSRAAATAFAYEHRLL